MDLNVGDKVRFIGAPEETLQRVLRVNADHVATITGIENNHYDIAFRNGRHHIARKQDLKLIKKGRPGSMWWV